MIVICIIITVIGSFICAFLKAKIDEWLGVSSMKGQSRLSLKRNNSNRLQNKHIDLIEISDDDSVDLSSNMWKSTEEYTNVSGTTNILNSATDASKYNLKHDISDDFDSDGDIIVDNVPDNNTSKSQSMFNWNKPIFDPLSIFPECSTSYECRTPKRKMIEAPNKKQKLMRNNSKSSNSSYSDDEFINFDFPKKDASPPQVGLQHNIMIAGTRVKLPVKPYPCQIAVMNSLILGCTKEQNCLLESPTGSGKTLALLCAALAWQEQYSEKIHREKSDEMDPESSHDNDDDAENFFLNSSQYFDEKLLEQILSRNKTKKVPKIFYGSRTHGQLEQVVKEFKKTAYRHKRMTILSSRKKTCIQETDKNKDKLCNELLDPRLKVKRCKYYNDDAKKKPTIFSEINTPWDIEDLVSLGKEVGSCPYFGARVLMADAEIIFCPYNYILYPEIRDSMQINLRGNIVILDEAHNIENICREAATVDIRDDKLMIAVKECKHFVDMEYKTITYATIHEYLTDLIKFLNDVEVKDNDRNEMVSKHWVGSVFRELLDVNKIGCPRFPSFIAASKTAIEDFNQNMKEENSKKVTENDSIIKKWTKVRTMILKCMNPAIVFAPLAHEVRSVILASGTLTPTVSYQSELGTKFSYIINPDHIIPKNQLYIRYITQGLSGKPLKATFDQVNTWAFQDELGNLVLQVCDAVPYGVLCFFSSYKAMNTIHNRWRNNGIWDKLSNLKTIFVEPKYEKDLKPVMREYRSVIEESPSEQDRTACGAIFFAVFRAKVAEGIDFSDNEARCVLAIGIPYLLQSSDITMKMEYNNLNKSNESRQLLTGSEWYTVNAFRALNQAIGRCVRHKNDWGAVLLVDKRYV
ncbi:Regulator of telomere elongation helicase 1 [Trachymyrmex cornetzi]|uniref:Regulator of telomere elongation helicase 1 n=1 Tax=Trachymyrmex cornetzi TaxID=471704 RepID=A0A151JQD7_9HYME|nr:Regulator of telomere elongation helicase 1 [Trachymyrmex cornetzi]